MRLLALQDDAVCISWVTVTATDGTKTSWHAGYAQQCSVPAWYPSPDLFPTTNYRPGCIWLTNQAKFPGLQAVSFKLTDLSFQSDNDTTIASSQFASNPETLCKLTLYDFAIQLPSLDFREMIHLSKFQIFHTLRFVDSLLNFRRRYTDFEIMFIGNAPGRMAFWKTSDPEDCIPFYDFVEEKNSTTGFDSDFGKIMTGQTMKCRPTGSMYTPSNFPTPNPPPSTTDGVGNFGGVLGEIPVSQVGQDPPQATPPPPPLTTDGAGSFGGVVGEIPNSEVGEPSPPTTTTPPPMTQTPTPSTQAQQTFDGNAGNQGAVAVSFNPGGPSGTPEAIPPEQTATTSSSKARNRRQPLDHASILKRRTTLEQNRDFCVDRLTISHISEHTATVVCQSETSWGPDFVSVVEGLYCDMCEKILWNLCGGPGDTYCFDLEVRELRFARDLKMRDLNGGSSGEEELSGLRKKYAKVDEWKM